MGQIWAAGQESANTGSKWCGLLFECLGRGQLAVGLMGVPGIPSTGVPDRVPHSSSLGPERARDRKREREVISLFRSMDEKAERSPVGSPKSLN